MAADGSTCVRSFLRVDPGLDTQGVSLGELGELDLHEGDKLSDTPSNCRNLGSTAQFNTSCGPWPTVSTGSQDIRSPTGFRLYINTPRWS